MREWKPTGMAMAALVAASLGHAESVHAQVRNAPERVEDLIPDDALSDPDAWASEGAESAAAGDKPSLSPRQSDLDLEALDIPTPEPLEPSTDDHASPELAGVALIDLPELRVFELSPRLQLAFPEELQRLPERSQIIDRFSSLSEIKNLEGDEAIRQQLVRQARSDQQLIEDVMRAYGYYDARITREVAGLREEAANAPLVPRARFDILPGKRYSFGKINLGERGNASDNSALREKFLIKQGDPLYADRIVEQRAALERFLSQTGYPFAAIGEPELLVDHARQEGDLTLEVEPNGKYVFGEIISDLPEFLSSRHLARLAQFAPGEIYQRSQVTDLRQAISATGLVTSVNLTPREVVAPAGSEAGIVALDVSLERAPLRTIAGAFGYGSEDGFKAEGRWEHRNLFPPEGSLTLRGILGTREQLASASFKRNNFLDRDQVLTIGAFVSDIETEAVDSRTIAVGATFERLSNILLQKEISWSLRGELVLTNERNISASAPAAPREEYLIGGLSAQLNWDTTDDLLDPSAGHRMSFVIAPDVSRSNSQTQAYVRTGFEASLYRSLGTTVLAGRARFSTINGADLLEIAPSRRLYAGGSSSVRGYGFQAIGPRDATGTALGGRSLAEFSLEGRIETGLLDGAVEVVPFLDAGSVADDPWPDFSEIRFGAGLGVRYKTSFGPIRVDVGVPLNPSEFDSPVAVYVSLGQAF